MNDSPQPFRFQPFDEEVVDAFGDELRRISARFEQAKQAAAESYQNSIIASQERARKELESVMQTFGDKFEFRQKELVDRTARSLNECCGKTGLVFEGQHGGRGRWAGVKRSKSNRDYYYLRLRCVNPSTGKEYDQVFSSLPSLAPSRLPLSQVIDSKPQFDVSHAPNKIEIKKTA